LTIKERLCVGFAFVAAGLAAYGAGCAANLLAGSPGPPYDIHPGFDVGLIVFFVALALMLKGVDAIRAERTKKEVEEMMRKHQNSK
jgi:hypothetical protein